ncbi:hypothetical protein JB92DRAFT_2877459 [Gautieria morchelliformis]|nr:hypothetical protein JB92DRAFT_2877459 [Gautieria morchelliformis]
MASSEQGNVVQQYSCRCHNIAINAYGTSPGPTTNPDTDYHRVFVGESGIHINHHYLTLRTRSRAQELQTSPNKLLQHLALSCLACRSLVYRVSQEISRGYEAREGPVVPTEDWVEQEALLSKTGWVEVYVGPSGCLVGKDAILQHFNSLQLSPTFSIGVQPYSDTPPSESSPLAQPGPRSSTDDVAKPLSLPSQLLPSLPALFPPPPFTPSHPVFQSLSAFAIAKSTEMRLQAEAETRSYAKAKLDVLEQEELRLRRDVEAIWRAYREGWNEVLGRVNEERRRSLPPKSDTLIPTSSARSGVPMSIRDFSPIVPPQPQPTPISPPTLSQSVPPPSTSLLSASMIQTGSHLPTSTRLPASNSIVSGSAVQYSDIGAPSGSFVPSSRANGKRPSASSSSMSPNHYVDAQYPGAFKRNMDTAMDIASSLATTRGEEEMRRRFGGGEDEQPKERARKRTSKNLGIGAVGTKPAISVEEQNAALKGEAQHIQDSGKQLINNAMGVPTIQILGETRRPSPGNKVRSELDVLSPTSKSKRRVTFVQPEVPIANKTTTMRPSEPAPEVELFDLDDLPGEHNQAPDPPPPSRPTRPQPVVRTPSYKLRANDGASTSQPASLPISREIPPQSMTNGHPSWIGSSTRRSVGLSDALPLLSSSVPAGDRILTRRSLETSTLGEELGQTPGTSSPPTAPQTYTQLDMDDGGTPSPTAPSNDVTESAEAELKHLLAASAPSHRHAWKEGGRAWEMFHQRERDKNRKIKGAIAEEGSDGTSSSLGNNSDASSRESLTNGTWRNPSHYASSLPIQIRPLIQYRPTLEPKTSLSEKHGVLVPPLKATNSRVDATAIRKAMYAERDRNRSIDPGPTLDFSEQEDIEDEDVCHDSSDGERGRRHALSILQAGSVIPEAGMWRSMAS